LSALVVATGCSFTHGTTPPQTDATMRFDAAAAPDTSSAIADAVTDAALQWTVIDTLGVETYAPGLTPTPTTSNVVLLDGRTYRLRASGMFPCTTGGTPADAEYWDFTAKNDTTSGIDFGISINDVTPDGNKTHWGPYSASHVYEVTFAGTGAPITATLFDSQYDNNQGTLKLEILELR
jgi:hypothetical protein